MTTDQNLENTPKKLTLGSTNLALGKAIENKITRTYLHSKSNTIVEIKKSPTLKLSVSKSTSLDQDSEELNKRLNILKKASEEEVQHKHTLSLTKLAAINNQPSKYNIEEPPDYVVKDTTAITPKIEDQKQYTYPEDADGAAGKKKIVDTKTPQAKPKPEDNKKLKKTDIFGMLAEGEGAGVIKTRSLASIKRAREKEKRKMMQPQKQEKVYREVIIPESITVSELSLKMAEPCGLVIKELMKLGIVATSHHALDADTAELIVSTFGHTVKRVQESDVENVLIQESDKEEDLKPRAPVVTVMGHVDHGKTSLLDALKMTDVVSTEAGGITQHIGAYKVSLQNGKAITFIDTPGHEAFTEMRIRGAQITDIVVLVVAADDGIKAQTVEAINHAKAAEVPIIVAINKIDKPDINIDRVKNELLIHGLVAEDLGGDVIIIPVSALKKINLDKLEEAILLLAEMQELTANPHGPASGVVVEAKLDKARGVVATVLVSRGTLKTGDLVVAGSTYGRVRKMNNDKFISIETAAPSDPVEIYGLDEAPNAGDKFNVVVYEKQARDITEYRLRQSRIKKVAIAKKSNLDDLFLKASSQNATKELSIIIKGDTQGSIEAIAASLRKLPNEEVQLKILHSAVGGISESDVTLSCASNALILGFNVRANGSAVAMAEKNKVSISYYSIIYNLIDDVKAIMSGMLSPIVREEFTGFAEVRQVFNISKVGKVAGSYITKGVIKKGSGIRLLRDNIVIYEGKLQTLRRFKDDVKEAKEGFECGVVLENYSDVKVGDVIEAFDTISEKKQLM